MHMQEHQAKLNFNTYKCQECQGILRKVIFIRILFIFFKIFFEQFLISLEILLTLGIDNWRNILG